MQIAVFIEHVVILYYTDPHFSDFQIATYLMPKHLKYLDQKKVARV